MLNRFDGEFSNSLGVVWLVFYEIGNRHVRITDSLNFKDIVLTG